MNGPTFWNDQEKAKATIAELKSLNSVLKPFEALLRQAENLETLIELAEEGETDEFDEEVRGSTKTAETEFNAFEFRSMLGGPNDHCNAYVTIHAGAGGTEACDWSEMLLRMYLDVGRGQGVQDRDHRPGGRRSGRASRRRPFTSRVNTPMATSAARRGSIAWCASVRLTRMHAGTPRLRRWTSFPRLMTRSTSCCGMKI